MGLGESPALEAYIPEVSPEVGEGRSSRASWARPSQLRGGILCTLPTPTPGPKVMVILRILKHFHRLSQPPDEVGSSHLTDGESLQRNLGCLKSETQPDRMD